MMFKVFSAGDTTKLSPDLTIESSVDVVSAIGCIDITRDHRGLLLATKLKQILAQAIDVLEQDLADGKLPDVLQVQKPTVHSNPLL